MPEITIKVLSNDNFEIWDDLVQRSPNATLIHNLNWLKIIEKHTQSKLYLFAGYLGNQIIAAIPFFLSKKLMLKTFTSPIGTAMVQNLGPIIPEYDIIKQDKREYYFREFQKELDIFIYKNFNPNLIKIITAPELLDARPYVWNGYTVTPRYNYIKNIEDLDGVWTGLKKQLRKNIDSAKKAGIIVDEGNLEDFKFVIQLLSGRLHDQELAFTTSREYLNEIFHSFYPDNLKIFIAKKDNNPITGIIVLLFKNKVTIWVGATQAGLHGVYPVDLLQWEIIEWGHKNGYKYCEILGANMPSISYFKSRYNFNLEIYFAVEKERGVIRSLKAMRSLFR